MATPHFNDGDVLFAHDLNGLIDYADQARTDTETARDEALAAAEDAQAPTEQMIKNVLANMPGIPYAMAAGSLTMQGIGTQEFDLPAGRFTQPPNIVISGSQDTQSPTQDVRAWATSPTKFRVRYQRADDWQAEHTGARSFNWQAVQMTPTSAEG